MTFEMQPPVPAGRPGVRRVDAAVAACVAAFVLVLVVGLTYAKWWPYGHKLAGMLASHVYPGHSPLDAAGSPGAAPSWHAAWNFAVAYGKSVRVALVVALLIAAGVETLLPRDALLRALRDRGRFGGSLVGGAMSLPSMMCTCCTAPVTASMRRSGVPTATALAYWVGNPTLNPAVLAFLLIVLPWPYLVTRLAVGAVLVFGATALVARLAPGRSEPSAVTPPETPVAVEQRTPLRAVPVRYVRALVRFAVVLIPEYAVVVLLMGALRGWLLPLGHAATQWGIGAALIAALAGVLMVIPTGGEIPVITGLLAAGFGPAVAGALLIALPAVSLPSMVMVGRGLTWRVTLGMAVAVAAAALASAGLLAALSAVA